MGATIILCTRPLVRTRLLLSRNVLRDRGNNDVEGEEDDNQTVVLLLLTIIAFIRNITTRNSIYLKKNKNINNNISHYKSWLVYIMM